MRSDLRGAFNAHSHIIYKPATREACQERRAKPPLQKPEPQGFIFHSLYSPHAG
jgi:hypothetical protein